MHYTLWQRTFGLLKMTMSENQHRALNVAMSRIGELWLWHVCGWYQGNGSQGACWLRDFGEAPLQNMASCTWSFLGQMPLLFWSITTFHAVSFSSKAISIADTYNPDAGVTLVFNGILRTIKRMAVGGMSPSASQTSYVGIAMAQGFFLGTYPSDADEIRWVPSSL